ncbi:MAG: toxin-antitoxin system YwqK family antitoxin, partial [Bacteroidales bacterium]
MMKKQLLILLALSLTTQLVLAQTLFRNYYDITRKKVKEEYQADGYGNKNGTYKIYSEYGGVVVSGTYNSKSEKIGTWIERYTGGKIWRKYSYDKKGRRHGVEAEYFPSGEKRYEANWRHGKQHGRVLEWNAEVAKILRLYDDEIVTLYKKRSDVDRHLIEEKYYKNGVIDSIWRWWDDSGELIDESFHKNGVELRGEKFRRSYGGCNTRVSTIVGD